MKLNKHLSLIIKSLAGLIVTLLLTAGLLHVIDISFTSENARQALLEQIQTITNRDVRIDGEVRIKVSLVPEVLVERIHIKNTDGFGNEDLITVSEVRVEVALLKLLTGVLYLEELSADHAHVGLIKKKNGSSNWSFRHLVNSDDAAKKADKESSRKKSKTKQFSLGIFKLTDISVTYNDESDGKVIEGYLGRLVVDLNDRTKPQAEISGAFQGSAYDLIFESDDVQQFTSGHAWEMRGTGKMANRNTKCKAVLQLKENVIEGYVEVNVQDINLGMTLEKLGIVSGQDAKSKDLNLNIKIRGEDATELYQKAEISLNLGKGYWKPSPAESEKNKKLLFNDIALTTSWDKPVEFHLEGSIAGEVISINFKTNRFKEFFDEVKKLDVNLEAHVAGSDITAKGTLDLPVKTKQFRLDISIKGDDLEKLNRILDSEFPPFNHYNLTGKISANETGFIVKAEDATIGNTHFNTTIVIDTSSFKPYWNINLNSRQLQLKDFEFADLKTEKLDAETVKAALQKSSEQPEKETGRNLKQIVENPKMHFDLNLNIEKLLAGESALGSSIIKLKLRDKTLILEDAELNIPGGTIISTAEFKIENKEVWGTLKLDIDKFEYGVVMRYLKHGSNQGGIISTKVDLKLGGKDFSRLFDHATGKLDVALWPGNTQTQLFDLWASNLFLLLLPEIRKKESKVNCMVALMDLEDGTMKEDFFSIDTTKVWMTGNITVDFAKEHVELSLFPRSKTARLYAVQAPIRAEGKFNNIKLITNPIDITAAYISFITSPLHVPARWVFGDKVPEDASEICEKFYDRAYVKKLKEKLKAEEQKEIDEMLNSD